MNSNQQVIENIKAQYPGFSIIKKSDSLLMKVIDITLKIITFGQMKTFMTNFITTLSYTVYVPNDWDTWDDTERAIILSHEKIHMDQRTHYGLFLFSLMYLFILPAIWTYRAKFEMEAYEVSIRLTYEVCQNIDYMKGDYKQFILSQFTSGNYMWMCPFRSTLDKWYDGVINTL